ncbi:MAG: hypothetical protein WC389_12850 [Lutibacter sp.]
MDKFKLRDENGKWINRCNRCGKYLDKFNRRVALNGVNVCKDCLEKYNEKYKWKIRNIDGFLVYRCNRCGAKLENDFALAGKEPVCLDCASKIKEQYVGYFFIKRINQRKEIEQHRQVFYDKAINKLIDGKGNVEYAKERWRKLKQIKK